MPDAALGSMWQLKKLKIKINYEDLIQLKTNRTFKEIDFKVFLLMNQSQIESNEYMIFHYNRLLLVRFWCGKLWDFVKFILRFIYLA